MQFFLAQVEQGKNTVCAGLRASAVKKIQMINDNLPIL
jgi:hypothetical protein